MITLGIDTCGASGTIALAQISPDGAALLAQTELAGRSYSAQLVPALHSLLTKQHLKIASLDAIVVVNGPGSFTGIRVGVSSAKGLAEALSIPLLAISRLATLAQKARTQIAALNAGRNELYVRQNGHEALLAAVDATAFSEPVAICERRLQSAFTAPVLVDPPIATDALSIAAPRLLAGETNVIDSLDGNYVRRPDAELASNPTEKL